ncbi:hypothetical protein F383_35773 [Gossypium arboreum]|uniref:Uncharacterized protein n=1 Tax=Gossypium arboreum TaxID=29729 RepID=A0A0B0PS12_GOSAR|nr:hypothetical protein F383_35773 [Gossypium arboreum]
MPKSPQNWPFSNWTKLGLGRDTLMYDCLRPWTRLLNGHWSVIYPCESHFNFSKLTRLCGLPL